MADQAYTPSDEQAETGPEGPSRRFNRQSALAILVVLIVLSAGAVFALTRGKHEPPRPTTTTAREPASTTSTVKKLPVGTYQVATVKSSVSKVHVKSEPPAEWADSEAVLTTATTLPPPLSQDSAPARPPIPSKTESVTGRYLVDGGWDFSNPGPYEPPQPLTFLVIEQRGDWLEVLLPVRPNGTVGYLKADSVDLTTTQHRIEIHVLDHKLALYDGDELVVESPIVAGVNFSPTPTGVFSLTDIVPEKNPNGFYGPYILATNGYSEVLNEFDDGVPVFAVHGTNRPELLGQDKSNGCVRVPNDVITKIAETVSAGTPILIWP